MYLSEKRLKILGGGGGGLQGQRILRNVFLKLKIEFQEGHSGEALPDSQPGPSENQARRDLEEIHSVGSDPGGGIEIIWNYTVNEYRLVLHWLAGV